MSVMAAPKTTAPAAGKATPGRLLQRKCACGSHTSSDECPDCLRRKRLQPKLEISVGNDPLEQEADRIADQVTAGPPDHLLSTTPVRIQRFTGQATGDKAAAPVSVDRALASPGFPLDPSLRQGFEQRFGYDFSRVRVHSDEAAAQSARDINAHAYTIGDHIVFAPGQFVPGTRHGRQLIAHELVHVVQQNGTARCGTVQRSPEDAPVHFSKRNLAAREGVPTEKWSEIIEAQYEKRRDFERAEAVRQCRTQGGEACTRILTLEEVRRLFDLARRGKGDETAIIVGLAGAAPLLSKLVKPTLRFHLAEAPPLVMPPLQPVPIPPVAPAPPVARPVPVIAPRPGAGVGMGRILGGGSILLSILVVAGTELWEFGTFQIQLRRLGYVILEDPLALCIEGCHIPSPPFRSRLSSPTLPGEIPLSVRPQRDIEKWLEAERKWSELQRSPEGQPTTAEQARRQRRRRQPCELQGIPPLGDDVVSQHFCEEVTGAENSTYKIWHVNPVTGRRTGRWAEIDVLRGNTWFECKCGYQHLLGGKPGRARAVLAKLTHQVLNHQDIARDCGLEYRYIVSNEFVANLLRREWHGNVVVDVRESDLCP